MKNLFKTCLISLSLLLTACTVTMEHVFPEDFTTPPQQNVKVIVPPPSATPTKIITKTLYRDCTPTLLKESEISKIKINKEIFQSNADIVGYVKALERNDVLLIQILQDYKKNKGNCE